MSYAGKMIFVLGVSGSGKGTVIDEMIASDLWLKQLKSYTTRLLRPWEINGQDYHHVTMEEFQKAIDAGDFLEYQQNYKLDWYGTKMSDVMDVLIQWEHAVKETDMKWLISISQNHPDVREATRSIFINVDDETMRQRISSRAPTPEDIIQRRVETAHEERPLAHDYCTNVIDGNRSREEVAAEAYELIKSYLQENK